jgi:hypothetical protein
MARISNVELSVVEDVANADIEIDYDIDWDSYDRASNQLYQENWKLVGDDTGPVGEDGEDETLTGQGAADIVRFAADGQSSTHRHLAFTIPVEALNDDTTGEDEVRAVVTLTPVGPFGDSEESRLVRLTVR